MKPDISKTILLHFAPEHWGTVERFARFVPDESTQLALSTTSYSRRTGQTLVTWDNKSICGYTNEYVICPTRQMDGHSLQSLRIVLIQRALRHRRLSRRFIGIASALWWGNTHSKELSPMSTNMDHAANNPDDSIRDAILRHLLAIHQDAKSPAKAAIGIRDLRAALKATHGFKQQQVGSNLDYLVQKGWVSEVKIERYFTTPKGTRQNSEQVKYKISNIGLDKLQQASLYQKTPMNNGINITNVHGVTVVGDGNVVNTNFTDLSRVLGELKTDVQANAAISDEQKLSVVADIDTLQAQLQKPEPNKSIIGMLWGGIEKVGKVSGLLTVIEKVRGYVQPLLG